MPPSLFVIFGFVILCVFAATRLYTGRVRTTLRTAIIFRHLALLVRQNMPLPMGLQFAAWGESGSVRRILMRTSRLLQAGLPLGEALRRAHPGCPGLLLSVVQAAERAGTLPAVLGEIIERDTYRQKDEGCEHDRRWGYVVATVVLFLVVFYGANYYVVPRLAAIMADYDAIMPAITTALLEASPFTGADPTTALGWLFRLVVVGMTLLPAALLAWGIVRLRPRRADRVGPLQFLGDLTRWHLWPWRWLALPDACAASAPSIRLATAGGWPLPDAVEQAAELDTNWFWRRRLRAWAGGIRQGLEPVAAGRACGVPEVFLRAVAVGVRDGDLDAPLQHAERYYVALARRRRVRLVHLIWPAVTLCLAAVVGLFCLGLVLAIKTLIEQECAQLG